jgi:hypothetical protein
MATFSAADGGAAFRDGEPGVVQLSTGLRQLQAEEAADGLFQGSDGFGLLGGGSLFPGDFETFESSAEFQPLRLCGGAGRQDAEQCADAELRGRSGVAIGCFGLAGLYG